MQLFKEKNVEMVDTTCPWVAKVRGRWAARGPPVDAAGLNRRRRRPYSGGGARQQPRAQPPAASRLLTAARARASLGR
jgi:hypothetical protein